jgi:hypothetical protein
MSRYVELRSRWRGVNAARSAGPSSTQLWMSVSVLLGAGLRKPAVVEHGHTPPRAGSGCGCNLVVHGHRLGVHEAGPVLVDLHARTEKLPR